MANPGSGGVAETGRSGVAQKRSVKGALTDFRF